MSGQEIFDKSRQNFTNFLVSALTGEPTPGSNEDYRRRIETQTLRNQLESLQRDPDDPARKQRFLDSLKSLQALQQAGQAASNRQNLDLLGAPSLLDAGDRQIGQRIREADARTRNDISVLDERFKRHRIGYGDVSGHELALADREAMAMDKALAFYREEGDKNRAAQKEARNFNISTMLNNLPGLALAVVGALA